MKRINVYFLGLLILVVAGTGTALAESNTVDDIVLLAGKGLGEEVLLAYVDRAEGTFTLSAEQIVNLKTANVPERVIAAMIRKKSPDSGYELQTSRERILYRTERATATTTQPLTTLVYQPSSNYVSTYYPSAYYYPVSSSYYSPYYSYSSPYYYSYSSPYYWPSSYYGSYCSPRFSVSFGSWPYYSSWNRCGYYRAPSYRGSCGPRPMPFGGSGGGRPHGGGGRR